MGLFQSLCRPTKTHPLSRIDLDLVSRRVNRTVKHTIWKLADRLARFWRKKKDRTVWSIAPEATVFEDIELMAQKNVGALPVVDNGRLTGIISERDYTRKVILKGKSSKEIPVKEIMTDEVLTVETSVGVTESMR